MKLEEEKVELGEKRKREEEECDSIKVDFKKLCHFFTPPWADSTMCQAVAFLFSSMVSLQSSTRPQNVSEKALKVSFTNYWESLNMTSKFSRKLARSIELSLTVGVTQAALSETGLDLTWRGDLLWRSSAGGASASAQHENQSADTHEEGADDEGNSCPPGVEA
jgi:hypothetical protein